MYSIFLGLWGHLKSLKPAFCSRTPHFNFITIHYFYLIGMAFVSSICLFANGNLKYVDALFLGSGACTQSGLNTVDINLLTTWQQVTIYLTTVICNPIAIHSFVVFLRLYWFEKRFQHVAREAKKNRRSMAKTVSKAKTTERDIGEEEKGVNGRDIFVMHGATRPNGITNNDAVQEDFNIAAEKANTLQAEERAHSDSSGEASKAQSSNSGLSRDLAMTSDSSQRPQIKFADQVKRSNGLVDADLRMPVQRSNDEHIAFLERQRQLDDGAVLRIPGPRDADAGVAPEAVDETDPASRMLSRRASTFESSGSGGNRCLNGDDHVDPPRRNITIAEPTRVSTKATEHIADDINAARHTFGSLKFRKSALNRKKTQEDDASRDGALTQTRSKLSVLSRIKTSLTREKQEGMPYLSWEATVGRNSAFVDLTESQREELGGIEYRSLKSLALILTLYFWGFMIFAVISLTPWILRSNRFGPVVDNAGQSRTWWGIFTANSAMNDLGFTLTPDSMISFQAAQWPLVLMSFLIIIGNTGFPIMLRFIIWVTAQYVPKSSGIWEELKFLLDHPRRCFTLLFPAKATWWLFWILVFLNGLDLLLFIVIDLGNTVVTDLPTNIRILDGWFQAVSTRTAGFGVINLAELHPGIQVSYLIMMYISVLPIAISVRRTNVYEEKALGIYGSAKDENENEGEPSYVGAHLRRQLSFDLWYIFLGFFIIAIAEGGRIQSGDPSFTMFSILFEIVSAYGTVGLSLGYTGINASFSAEFGTIAKLVIIAMQIRGRHRGLPYELDRAILLPSEHLQEKEAADASARAAARRPSTSGGTMTNIATVSSGGAKSVEKVTSRSTERSIQAQNFLSSILHPGPSIPSSHRNVHRIDPMFETARRRRHSISVTEARPNRSVSPRNAFHFAGTTPLPSNEGSGDERGRRMEGRRHFYQDGLNPHTPLSPTVMKEEGPKND